MRILHVINSLEAGGAQKLLADMLPIMAQYKGVKISVVVFNIKNSDNERILNGAGIDIINLNAPTLSFKSFRQLIPLIKGSDIVHVHLFAANYIVAIANMFANKPLIFTEHSTHNKRRNHKWLKPVEQLIYRQFDSIICISEQTAQTLTQWIGQKIADKRIVIIKNGIDILKYQNAKKKTPEELFGRTGIPILMVSRFVESKDQPTMIRALRYIKNPDVYIVFVGDGPLKTQAERIAEETGMSDRILFLGSRNDVPEIIKVSRVGVQSSNWEGFGLTAVEMMAGGIPVIASDVDGLKQVVEEAGLIFHKGDEQDLAKQINMLLDSDNSQSFITNGINRANDYSINNTTDEYVELYRQVKFHHNS